MLWWFLNVPDHKNYGESLLKMQIPGLYSQDPDQVDLMYMQEYIWILKI